MGIENLCEYLLWNRADVNAKDTLGRTPLYFALAKLSPVCIKSLLLNNADPWGSSSICSYKDLCQNDPVIANLVQKCRQMDMALKMSHFGVREELKARILKTIFLR
jgi:ankyrin repeat protein